MTCGHVFNTGLQKLASNLLARPDGTVNDIAALQQTLRNWAADVKLEGGDNLAAKIISQGLGREYHGGRREGWCLVE